MQCKQCQKDISNKNKFCSKSCSTSFNNTLRTKCKKVRNCLNCQESTSNKKFCSTKCAAIFNNKPQPRYCQQCNNQICLGFSNAKYCKACRHKTTNKKASKQYVDWSLVPLQYLFDKLPIFQANARIRALSRQIYRYANKEICCSNCGYSKFIEVCHIKAIANFPKETPISVVNALSNLIGLCPNCHWELDHGLLKI
jgi:hypothetical protein